MLVGTLLRGYCGGVFRNVYAKKRIEAIGADWIVVRDQREHQPHFAAFLNTADMRETVEEWIADPGEPEDWG